MTFKLKICGLKESENILQVADLCPDYMGFIFFEGSRRYVNENDILPDTPANIKRVGVFVNAEPHFIIDKINEHHLQGIQLHGNESPALCESMSHLVEVIKAFGVDENFDLADLNKYKDSCQYFLFDTKAESHGGTGTSFDWELLRNYPFDVPFFISGGIGLKEIESLMNSSLREKIFGIDVNSKFELQPGLKDIDQLSALKKILELNSVL